MEVTRGNFEVASARVLKLLPATVAIGLDMECTGIKPDLSICRADTPPEYYYKVFPVPGRYRMIQLGLSLFVPAANGYTAHTFFFYLLPDSQNECIDSVFRLSVATIEFLNRADNIDYNKWLKGGISYYNRDQRQRLAEAVDRGDIAQQLAALSVSANPTRIRDPAELRRLSDSLAAFEQWFASKSADPFVFAERKPYLRRYFHENNKTFHAHRAELSVAERRNGAGTPTAEFRRHATAPPGAEERLEQALGFSRLWDEVKEAVRARNIAVVGHNVTIDLLFVAAAFERSLPRRYSEAKELLAGMFPRVFDTKAMAEALGLEALSLAELHAEVVGARRDKKTLQFAHAHGGGLGYHNAGADAQATGEVFLTLLTLIQNCGRFANCLKVFSTRFYHIDLCGKATDSVTPRAAVVLYPKSGAATKELLLMEVKQHNRDTKEENFVIEHRGLPCNPALRVYFVDNFGKAPISPQLQQRVSANFAIKSLEDHYNEVYTFLEKLDYS